MRAYLTNIGRTLLMFPDEATAQKWVEIAHGTVKSIELPEETFNLLFGEILNPAEAGFAETDVVSKRGSYELVQEKTEGP